MCVLCVWSCALLLEACPFWMERLVARKQTVEGAGEGECELVDDIARAVVAERIRYLPLHIVSAFATCLYRL